MRANYRMQRLHVNAPLAVGEESVLGKDQTHYVLHVMRMENGHELLVFNGIHGEFLARIEQVSKKAVTLRLIEQTRAPPATPDLVYCFAPIKAGRLDYMVQKAVEMGVGTLQPVQTQHTQLSRIGIERIAANALEAAEQCGNLALPDVRDMVKLDRLLADWDPSRRLLFCDESAAGDNPLPILQKIEERKIALLVGPEGGFSDAERKQLHMLPFVTSIPLGPRILRADTAAVAALALIQAVVGDWG